MGAETDQPRPTKAPRGYSQCAYWLGRLVCRIPFALCVKVEVVDAYYANRGNCILACTHMGHLEAPALSLLLRRRIDWMARIEFYRYRPLAWMLRMLDAIPVRRHGVPAQAIRTAIERAKSGRMIGVFPEGGVATGTASVCRGGPIKQGTCLIAMAAGVPIVPVVVMGVEALSHSRAWLPTRSSRLWVIFGRPLMPPPSQPGRAFAAERRAQRAEMSVQLQHRFMELHDELRRRYEIPTRSHE
jgi:1-acyl-sn-glycerol-3-phosphate acyltransferase